MTANDDPAIENRYFDQHFCGKVMRIGAAVCAAVVAGDCAFLLMVDPSHSRCPGWAMPAHEGGGSVWYLVAMVGLWVAWLCYCAIRWDWVARRRVDRIERDELMARGEPGGDWRVPPSAWRVRRARKRLHYTRMIDFGSLLIVIMCFSTFFCATPVL